MTKKKKKGKKMNQSLQQKLDNALIEYDKHKSKGRKKYAGKSGKR